MKNLQNFVYEKVGSTHIFQTAEMYTKSCPNFLKFSEKVYLYQHIDCTKFQKNQKFHVPLGHGMTQLGCNQLNILFCLRYSN